MRPAILSISCALALATHVASAPRFPRPATANAPGLRSEDLDERVRQGAALFRQGRFAEAAAALRPVAAESPYPADVDLMALEYLARSLVGTPAESDVARVAALTEADALLSRMTALARERGASDIEVRGWFWRARLAPERGDLDLETRCLGEVARLASQPAASDATRRWALVAAGKAHRRRNEFEAAIAAFETASQLDVPAQFIAEAYSLISESEQAIGRYARARAALLRVLDTLRSPALPGAAKLKIDAADRARDLGELRVALDLLDTIDPRELADHPFWAVNFWNSRALVRERFGDDERMIADLEQGLTIPAGPADGGVWRTHLGMRVNRGRARLRSPGDGDLAAAAADFDTARAAAEIAGWFDIAAAAMEGQARVMTRRGDFDGARRLAEAALDVEESAGLVEYALSTSAARVGALLRLGERDAARQAIATAVARLDAIQGPSIRTRFSEWSWLRQDCAAAELLVATPDRLAEITRAAFRQNAEDKSRVLLEGLTVRRPRDRGDADGRRTGVEGGTGDLDDLDEVLGDDLTLVEYAAGADELYAYVFDRGALSFHRLGPREPIEHACRDYRRRILELHAGSPSDLEELGHALHEKLLAPLRDRGVPPGKPLVIAPTAEISTLPFDALVTATQAPKKAAARFQDVAFLLRARSVTLVPSASVVIELDRVSGRRAPGPALIIGDARFASVSDSAGRSHSLRELKQTREECLVVADWIIPETGDAEAAARAEVSRHRSERSISRRDDLSIRNEFVEIHLGGNASPATFQGDLRRHPVIHIATHGLVDGFDPRFTRLLLSPDADGDADLDLDEIRRLDLDAELVVLSACHTAQGPILRGEGVQSLAASFMEAGARGVVASLCPVDDAVTRDLMARFYGHRDARSGSAPSAGVSAAALRRAKLDMLEDPAVRGARPEWSDQAVTIGSGHPYLWASFVYMGISR